MLLRSPFINLYPVAIAIELMRYSICVYPCLSVDHILIDHLCHKTNIYAIADLEFFITAIAVH
ncbi:MAG: hypothetical protein AAGA80_24710 [Cyanobacteria bacterium P01_F01_bin.143]